MRVRIALIGFGCLLLALVATVGPASASVTPYTNEATFVALLQPGYYLEDWNYDPWRAVEPEISEPQSFSSGGWSYDIISPGSNGLSGQPMPPDGGAVAPYRSGSGLKVTFDTDALPSAVGGIFWVTDINGNFLSGRTVTITLSEGGDYIYADSSNWDAFTGFISSSPITSMTLSCSDWATMDHLYVGDAIPEPGTMIVWALLGAASWLGMGIWRRGRRVGRQPWSDENRQAIHELIAR